MMEKHAAEKKKMLEEMLRPIEANTPKEYIRLLKETRRSITQFDSLQTNFATIYQGLAQLEEKLEQVTAQWQEKNDK